MISPAGFKQIGIAAALVIAAGVAYWKGYAQPRDHLLGETDRQLKENATYEDWIARRDGVRAELKRMGAGTISAQGDQATARFRSALGELGRQCGLEVSAVNSVDPEKVGNPAASKTKGPVASKLKEKEDFEVIRGSLTGTGTLEQVLRAVAAVQAQPWVHRVESFTLKPEDAERQKFSVTLGVATILLRDLAPRDLPEPRIIPLDPMASARWEGIVRKNPFREPPMQVARADAPPPPAPPPGPPPTPWGDWKLTGIIETHKRIEAFMVNTRTQEAKVLNIGSSVTGATLVSAARDSAVFDVGGQHFEVQIGQTLEQRSPTAR